LLSGANGNHQISFFEAPNAEPQTGFQNDFPMSRYLFLLVRCLFGSFSDCGYIFIPCFPEH